MPGLSGSARLIQLLSRIHDPVVRRPDEQALTVLKMLSKGMTDAAIARALGVSLRTERRIITALMDVLNARTRFQLGQEAIGGGYL